MNIALFGGSFDPPHIGHKMIVKQALSQLDIDQLIVMPTFLNPFKSKSHFSSKQRLLLTKELFDEFDNVIVSNYEIQEAKKVSTIQTVSMLYKKYNISKIYLIIGADNLAKLHLWDSFDKLSKLVEFIVATRDNISISNNFKILNIQCNISSSKIRESLDIIEK